MPVAPSFDDLITAAKAELQSRRPELLVSDGDVSQALLHASASMTDAVIAYAAQAFLETFLDGAKGDALTTLVDDRYSLSRHAATSSTGQVTFSRTNSGGAGTIPQGTTVSTSEDASGGVVEFTTDAAITVNAGSNGPWIIGVTATATGRGTNVRAGEINRVNEQPSFDDSFTVTNTLATGGGNDEETDEALRARARDYFSSQARGTLDALKTGALQVSTVRNVSVIESDTGVVTVAVSDVDGNSSIQMVDEVAAELESWRAAGIPITVTGGTRRVIDMTIQIDEARAGFILSNYSDSITAAIEDVFNNLASGENCYLDQIVAAVISVAPREIRDISITEILLDAVSQPIVDIVAGDGDVLRAGTVTVVEA